MVEGFEHIWALYSEHIESHSLTDKQLAKER
jgi:hypothetical protein